MPDNQPLSWRDVYKAVEQSEQRIVAAINAAVTPLSQQASDHEHRLRTIENNGTPRVQRIEASVTALHARVDILEARETMVEGRQSGVMATLSAGQKTILLFAAIVGIVIAVLDIASHL
jgi:predicted RecB family endonuclease